MLQRISLLLNLSNAFCIKALLLSLNGLLVQIYVKCESVKSGLRVKLHFAMSVTYLLSVIPWFKFRFAFVKLQKLRKSEQKSKAS